MLARIWQVTRWSKRSVFVVSSVSAAGIQPTQKLVSSCAVTATLGRSEGTGPEGPPGSVCWGDVTLVRRDKSCCWLWRKTPKTVL